MDAETQTPAWRNSCWRGGNLKLDTAEPRKTMNLEGNSVFAAVFRQEYKLQKLNTSFFKKKKN